MIAAKARGACRSVQRQMRRRALERQVKIDVLALVRWCRIRDWCWARIEALVRVSAETLRRWLREWREDRMALSPRGRPLSRSHTEVRNQVFAALGLLGAGTSVAVMAELFPHIARRELEDLVARFRRVYRKRGTLLHQLTWSNDSAVWAMDFTEAPSAIDKTYPYVLVVRDLGSGKLLLSLPANAQSAQVTCDALRALFREHGVPLVLKSDNGAAFVAEQTQALLAAREVLPLLSPPGTPRFNGACEAGIGGLKIRAHYEAARHGRPGEWTCNDVETGRLIANETSRPRGAEGATPDELWAMRLPAAERTLLKEHVDRFTTEVRAEREADGEPEQTAADEAAIARIALVRALVYCDHLQLRRRRFTLPIEMRRAGNIS